MKTCVYCKEEVHDDATKCRYCGSDIGTDTPTPPLKKRYVTYIVDRDLIRFIKVAAAFLTLFLLVGAFFYGFDLKQAAKEIRAAQQEAIAASQKTMETEKAISRMKAQVESLVADAGLQVARIKESSKQAELIVISLQQRHSTATQVSRVQTTRVETDLSLSRSDHTKLWANGARLRIRFLEGDRRLQVKIRQAAELWLSSTNLQYEWVSAGASEIRIGLAKDAGSWSYVGTDALNIPQDMPTMNFGWLKVDSSAEEIAVAVLPQFGYALGLLNEHQNPNADIPWNREVIIEELSGAPNFWNEDQIDRNIFKEWPPTAFPVEKPFDPESVMFKTFSRKWIDHEYPDREKTTLSLGDMDFIRKLYPRS